MDYDCPLASFVIALDNESVHTPGGRQVAFSVRLPVKTVLEVFPYECLEEKDLLYFLGAVLLDLDRAGTDDLLRGATPRDQKLKEYLTKKEEQLRPLLKTQALRGAVIDLSWAGWVGETAQDMATAEHPEGYTPLISQPLMGRGDVQNEKVL